MGQFRTNWRCSGGQFREVGRCSLNRRVVKVTGGSGELDVTKGTGMNAEVWSVNALVNLRYYTRLAFPTLCMVF